MSSKVGNNWRNWVKSPSVSSVVTFENGEISTVYFLCSIFDKKCSEKMNLKMPCPDQVSSVVTYFWTQFLFNQGEAINWKIFWPYHMVNTVLAIPFGSFEWIISNDPYHMAHKSRQMNQYNTSDMYKRQILLRKIDKTK